MSPKVKVVVPRWRGAADSPLVSSHMKSSIRLVGSYRKSSGITVDTDHINKGHARRHGILQLDLSGEAFLDIDP